MARSEIAKLIALIIKSKRLIQERVRSIEKTGRFSLSQIEILRYVSENKQPLMKDVADYLNITPPSATALIDSLVSQGYLKRIPDKKDRRIVKLTETLKGKKTLDDGMKVMKKGMKETFSKLSEKEINTLITIHSKLAKILQNK
jgi:DNA-binding MarR family transcriptional regulator